MASCPGPSTSFSAQVTVITETRTRTIINTAGPPLGKRWNTIRDDQGLYPWPSPTAQPAASPSDGRLIRRQGTSLPDPSSISDLLPTDGTSITLPTGGTSASESPDTSDGVTTTQSSSVTNGDTTSSTSPPISTSTRSLTSITSANTQITTETVTRTETIQVPIATITPLCPSTELPISSSPLSVPLSTFISGTSSGLWSSVIVTTVVTNGGSLSTIVTAVPTLISFSSKEASSQLQPGIVAGIVIGSLAALISMIVFACVFSRRRKKQQRTRQMTERVTIGRMLESEGFEDGVESPYRLDQQLPAPGYSSYDYGVVGSPTRHTITHSQESLKGDSSPRVTIYGQDNPGGVGITSESNVAANKRVIAARASGSSSGSIFRENFEHNMTDESGQTRSIIRASPPPLSGHGAHGGSIHEPLIRGAHDRFPSTSSGGSGQPLGPSHFTPSSYSGQPRGYGPPPVSYSYPLQSHHDTSRSASHPPIAYSQRQNWSSSSLPPGAAVSPNPHWKGETSQPVPPSRVTPLSPQGITSAVHSNTTHTTEPYFFLPDASDSYLLPGVSADNPSLLQDSDLTRHVSADPEPIDTAERLVEYTPDSPSFPPRS